MRPFVFTLVALATIAASGAHAQTPAPKIGSLLVSSDGKRIGRIDRVEKDRAGNASVSVIYDAHIVYIPIETLTVDADGKVTTSLTRKDVATRR